MNRTSHTEICIDFESKTLTTYPFSAPTIENAPCFVADLQKFVETSRSRISHRLQPLPALHTDWQERAGTGRSVCMQVQMAPGKRKEVLESYYSLKEESFSLPNNILLQNQLFWIGSFSINWQKNNVSITIVVKVYDVCLTNTLTLKWGFDCEVTKLWSIKKQK